MSVVEDKWKANQERVAFVKNFPGLHRSWQSAAERTIQAVYPLRTQPGGAVLVFSDGSFIIASGLTEEPRDLTEGLSLARTSLEPYHSDAYVEFDRLSRIDQEAGRRARLENILGAIQNNLEDIPELKDRLRLLVETWKS